MLDVVRMSVRVTSNNYLRLNFSCVWHIFRSGQESNPAPSAPQSNDPTNRRVPVPKEF